MSVAPTVLHVPPLSRTDLAEVISEPARRSHLTLEDGLVQRLVDDTGSGDALPLLAFTLARMADRRRGRPAHPRGVRRDRRRQGRDRLAGRRGRAPAAAPRPRWPRRSCTWSASPTRRRTSGWPGPPTSRRGTARSSTTCVDARLVVDQRGQRPAGLRPGARVAVLGLAAAGRADRAPPRRPGAARPAGAAGRRLAGGRRRPSPGCCPGSSSTRPASWRQRNADMATPDVAAYVDASVARQRRAAWSAPPWPRWWPRWPPRWSSRSRPRAQRRRRPRAGPSRRQVGELAAIAAARARARPGRRRRSRCSRRSTSTRRPRRCERWPARCSLPRPAT